jgi:AraC family transcriptional regulator
MIAWPRAADDRWAGVRIAGYLAADLGFGMNQPFKYADIAQPVLELGAHRQWGGLSARAVRASAGRHYGGSLDDHRVIFYGSGSTPTECGCDGIRQQRLQTPGDYDVVPSGADGYWEDAAPVEMVSVRMTPAFVDQVAEGLGAQAGEVHVATRLGHRDPLVEHVLRAISIEVTSPAPAARLYVDSLAWALASRILQGAPKGPWRARLTLSNAQLRRLIDYVEANLEYDLTLAELAGVAGVSVPHLTTLFRRTLGQSAHRYVVDRRLHRARALLLAGERSIASVAQQTGFAHQSHLARWMKRELGVSPTDLLRAN